MKHIKKLRVIFIFSLLVCLFWQCYQQKKVSVSYLDEDRVEHTLILSLKDRKHLSKFLEKLFAEDHFTYTLLGSKPVSWASFKAPFPFVNFTNFLDAWNKYNRTMHLGWSTWRKYHHLFPSSSFFIESSKDYNGSRSILLINKESFNSIVQENRADFESVLQRKVEDGCQLLGEAKNYSLMKDVLMGHHALLGIVLGYGRENSWQFQEKSKERQPLGWVWNETEYWGENERTYPYSSHVEYNLSLYSCPSFAGDPTSEESLALKKEYLKTKQRVLKYYKGQDFLEATLSLLAGFLPEE